MIQDVSGKDYAINLFTNTLYVNKIDNIFRFDPNRVKIDLYNYKICKNIYSLRVILNMEYEKYNYKVDCYDMIAEKIVNEDLIKQSFEDIVKALEEENKDIYRLETPIKDLAYKKYPFLKEAIKKLGFDGIAKSNYNITNIKNKLICRLDESEDNKIFKLLNNKIDTGDFVRSSKVKSILEAIYKDLNIKKVAKSTDLTRWYEVESSSKRIDGVKVKGYIINRPKIIFK